MTPGEVGPDDIRTLLDRGVEPEAISDAIHVVALFNLIDRVADGLGIEALPAELATEGAKFIVDDGY